MTTPTHATPVKTGKMAGHPNCSATMGPVPWPMAKPTGPLAVNVATAVPCLAASNDRPTMSIPAFQTTT